MKDCFSFHAKFFPKDEYADLLASAKQLGNTQAVDAALTQAVSELAEVTEAIGKIIRPGALLEKAKVESAAAVERAKTDERTASLNAQESARAQRREAQKELNTIRAAAKERMDKADPDVLAKTLHTNPTVENWMTPEERARTAVLQGDLSAAPTAPPTRAVAPRNDPFFKWVKSMGGISTEYASDLTGEKSFRANSMVPGLFRKQKKGESGQIITGHGLDEIASLAEQDHWILPSEDPVDALTVKIQSILRGESQIRFNVDEDAQYAAMRDAAGKGYPDEEQAAADELAASLVDQKNAKWDTLTEAEKDAELDTLFGKPASNRTGEETPAPAVGSRPEAELAAQTPADLAAKVARESDQALEDKRRADLASGVPLTLTPPEGSAAAPPVSSVQDGLKFSRTDNGESTNGLLDSARQTRQVDSGRGSDVPKSEGGGTGDNSGSQGKNRGVVEGGGSEDGSGNKTSGEEPEFKRAGVGTSTGGLTPAVFRSGLSDEFGPAVAARLIDSGVITPIADQSNLPAHVVPFVREGDKIFGFYDPKTDKTYAVLSNLNREMLRGLVLHEVGVHYGMKRMLGDAKYNQVLSRMNTMFAIGNPAVREARANASEQAVSKEQVAEETLAYLVQNHPKLNIVQEVIAAIKAFLFREFGIGGTMLTEADITALAKAAVEHSVKEPVVNKAPAFSRSDQTQTAAFTETQLESEVGRIKEATGLQKFSAVDIGGNEIELSSMLASTKGKGRGTKAMQMITAFADKHGARIMLDPASPNDSSTPGTTSRARLVEFYKRFGFTENKGRKRDFSVSYSMIREPATNPDIRFSRGAVSAMQSLPRVSGYVNGLLQSSGKLGLLNGINTQYHKALTLAKNGLPEFKAVFDKTQDYLNDITSIAVTAEQQAPGIFRELRGIGLDSIKQYFKGAATDADIAATQPALHVGTLFGGGNPLEGRKWTDAELKFGGAILPAKGSNLDKVARSFRQELKTTAAGEMRLPGLFTPLTDKQIELYKQARATIDQSLEDQAKSIIYRQVNKHGITFDKGISLADVAQIVQDQLDEAITTLDEREAGLTGQLGGADDARIQSLIDKAVADGADLKALKNTVSKIEKKAQGLIEHGYTPLQRFGNRVVTAKDRDGKTKFVGFYDGNPLIPKSADVDMNRAAMQLRQMEPTWTVTMERKSERAWQLYTGLNIDALENFLDFLDPETKANLERDATIQEYLQNAVNSRSTLTRMAHRKGTPGFSTDIPRTLASFITSNARSASGNYHGAEMKSLVEDIKQGDIKDEAADLVKYILEPQEEAAKLRSFLFFHFLGGSIAAGLVNLSQTPMMTMPALLAHGSLAKVTAALTAAARNAVRDPATITGDMGKALHRAELEGVTAPQMVHHLTATAANNPFSGNRQFRTFMAIWGGMFSSTEVFNRRVAFMAAYELADKTKGDPYEFAKGIVADTQLLYNKGNRPNLGRGTIGAVALTFKTFTLGYLELLKRLPPQQQLMMLGMLVLMAGVEGLPFAEDIEDLIDTLGQALGFTTNTGKWLGKAVRETLGEEWERPLLKGLGGMLPLDLHSRLGMGNIIPASAYFKASEIDKTRDVAEAVGPVGGVFKSFQDSLQMLARGRWDAAAVNAAPKAVRDAYNGAHMLATGEAQDIKGRLTLKDVTPGEAAGKAIGFNPQRAAQESETKREIMQDKNLRTVRMDEIAGDWADGILRRDVEKVTEAMQRFREWNKDNPELRIDSSSLMRSVQERVRAAHLTGQERFLKSVPKPMRADARQEFAR